MRGMARGGFTQEGRSFDKSAVIDRADRTGINDQKTIPGLHFYRKNDKLSR